MSRELVGEAAAETEVELRPPLGTGMVPKSGHDRFMSERTSVNATQLVIDRSGTSRFTPLWKPGSPLPQAGKHRVTSRTTRIPTPPTLPGIINLSWEIGGLPAEV